MPVLSKSAKEIVADYGAWLSDNPSKVRTMEAYMGFCLCFFAGKISKHPLATECVNTLLRLFRLFNNQLLYHNTESVSESAKKLKLIITLLEYCDILVEKSTQYMFGEKPRWAAIITLQLLKSIGKFTLLFHYRERLICYPTVSYDSSLAQLSKPIPNGEEENSKNVQDVVVLKRSRRIMRKCNALDEILLRTWKPPVVVNQNFSFHVVDEDQLRFLLGECIYLLKPILNLGVIMKYGYGSWKSWCSSLLMDLISLYLLYERKRSVNTLSRYNSQEQRELWNRKLLLMAYLLKSPYYEKYNQNRLTKILKAIPIFGTSLNNHVEFLLSSYFFHWSR